MTCRHHLYVDVSEHGLRTHNVEVWDLKDSCSLDVADAVSDGTRDVTYSDVGDLIGVSRALAQETGVKAVTKLKRSLTTGLPHLKVEPVRVFDTHNQSPTRTKSRSSVPMEESYAAVLMTVADGQMAATEISKSLGWDHGKTRQVLDNMRKDGILHVNRINHRTYTWGVAK